MKLFNIQYNIGKGKYVINYHNGVSKHNDGSDFYDIAVFTSKEKRKFEILKESLLCKGFIQS